MSRVITWWTRGEFETRSRALRLASTACPPFLDPLVGGHRSNIPRMDRGARRCFRNKLVAVVFVSKWCARLCERCR